MIVLKYQT